MPLFDIVSSLMSVNASLTEKSVASDTAESGLIATNNKKATKVSTAGKSHSPPKKSYSPPKKSYSPPPRHTSTKASAGMKPISKGGKPLGGKPLGSKPPGGKPTGSKPPGGKLGSLSPFFKRPTVKPHYEQSKDGQWFRVAGGTGSRMDGMKMKVDASKVPLLDRIGATFNNMSDKISGHDTEYIGRDLTPKPKPSWGSVPKPSWGSVPKPSWGSLSPKPWHKPTGGSLSPFFKRPTVKPHYEQNEDGQWFRVAGGTGSKMDGMKMKVDASKVPLLDRIGAAFNNMSDKISGHDTDYIGRDLTPKPKPSLKDWIKDWESAQHNHNHWLPHHNHNHNHHWLPQQSHHHHVLPHIPHLIPTQLHDLAFHHGVDHSDGPTPVWSNNYGHGFGPGVPIYKSAMHN